MKRILSISIIFILLAVAVFGSCVVTSASTITNTPVGIKPDVAGEGWLYYSSVSSMTLTWADKANFDYYGTHVFKNAEIPKTYSVSLSDQPTRIWAEIDFTNTLTGTDYIPIVTVKSGEEVQIQLYFLMTVRSFMGDYYDIPKDYYSAQCYLSTGEWVDAEATSVMVDSSVTGYDGDLVSMNIRYPNNSGEEVEVQSLRFGVYEDTDGFTVGTELDRFSLRMQMVRYRLFSGNQILGAEIAGAIGEQTDILTNGWSPNPSNPAGTDSIYDYESIEGQLLDIADGGITSGLSFVGNLSANFAQYANAFGVMISIFNIFDSVTWVRNLLYISLAFGIIAFVLNLAPSLGSSMRRYDERSKSPRRTNKKG